MRIEREIINQFKAWKDAPDRKPILLKIIPIEVKAEENITGSSLSVYNKTYSPNYRMCFSMLNLQYNCGLLSSPSALAGWLDKWMLLVRE